jgi:hypothetical protein
MSEVKIETSKGNLWLDFDRWKKESEFLEKKEKEYWDYVFSGQRDIDIFGVEGAKRMLEEQDKRDREYEQDKNI